MGKIVDINLKKLTEDKAIINEELENRLFGVARHLLYSQLREEYEKAELIALFYRQLNADNKAILEAFIEENPSKRTLSSNWKHIRMEKRYDKAGVLR